MDVVPTGDLSPELASKLLEMSRREEKPKAIRDLEEVIRVMIAKMDEGFSEVEPHLVVEMRGRLQVLYLCWEQGILE